MKFIVALIRSRFFITLAVIFLIGSVWKIYVSRNDDGIVTGYVVDENGVEASQATVFLNVGNLGMFGEDAISTETDEFGRFEFREPEVLEFDIYAVKEGYLETKKRRVHLYFEGQNHHLSEPIVIEKEGN